MDFLIDLKGDGCLAGWFLMERLGVAHDGLAGCGFWGPVSGSTRTVFRQSRRGKVALK